MQVPLRLVVQDVVKEFATPTGALRVLDGISFEVAAGEMVAVTGPSGSGKTTLISVVGSLEKPTAGTVLVDGVDVAGLSGDTLQEYRARRVGFIFQEHRLLPQLSAAENILVPTLAKGCGGNRTRCGELLEQVGIADKVGSYAWQLSGGQRQRVAIARALVNSPGLLLCDEPTGNLDRDNAMAITELLHQLADARQVAVVMVTHNAEVAGMCDRRMTMAAGKGIWE
jgi:lipoprotein-releasing system ATP-binding protein